MSSPVSTSYTAETRKAWAGSILFHLILLLIFYFVQVDVARKSTDFVEVTLGGFPEVPAPKGLSKTNEVAGSPPPKASPSVVIKRPTTTKLDLPERKFPIADEVIRLPEARKLDAGEQPEKKADLTRERHSIGEKELGSGTSIGGDKLTGEGKRGVGIEGGAGSGSEVGRSKGLFESIGYAIQWAGGGTRQKISGDLPTYPEGVNVEAQIRLQGVVAPDGSVKSVHPIQKAHVRLEEAALKEVRFWKFEPLDITQPQIDQTCTIVFTFKLK